jgi:hypothetical protein
MRVRGLKKATTCLFSGSKLRMPLISILSTVLIVECCFSSPLSLLWWFNELVGRIQGFCFGEGREGRLGGNGGRVLFIFAHQQHEKRVQRVLRVRLFCARRL